MYVNQINNAESKEELFCWPFIYILTKIKLDNMLKFPWQQQTVPVTNVWNEK